VSERRVGEIFLNIYYELLTSQPISRATYYGGQAMKFGLWSYRPRRALVTNARLENP
jgi:hypothetical protein